jgi:HSP20 family protein
MTLIRWNPALPGTGRELVTLQDEVSRLFDSFVGRGGLASDRPAGYAPAVDIEETAEEFVVTADLPGFSPKDVKVNLMGDTLTIRGERKQEGTRKDRNIHRVERRYGLFERTITFDTPVKNDGIRARYKDGVLEIVVPKAEEAKVREIEVQVAG